VTSFTHNYLFKKALSPNAVTFWGMVVMPSIYGRYNSTYTRSHINPNPLDFSWDFIFPLHRAGRNGGLSCHSLIETLLSAPQQAACPLPLFDHEADSVLPPSWFLTLVLLQNYLKSSFDFQNYSNYTFMAPK
jgi:hypothetical protein